MTPDDEAAILTFLKEGGQIRKVKEAIAVNEPEILDYLASQGLRVKYPAGESKTFLLNQRRYTLSGLVHLANSHRHSRELAPFAVRISQLSTQRRKTRDVYSGEL